ncbi:MAG: hypothetical protein GOVbin7744_7 [Prokaryotic dsDNA virus sp.]|nr:MAG: hypothetical protein GOVbin7744_7 [Prokaryotic dsDNA virus sp.]|tara:strand:- start:35042 stop:35725 length:684 start_codon:yes stop_codon:yes gene_type:complete
MALILSENGGGSREPFEPVPAGSHTARVVTLIDLGLQESTWEGTVRYREEIWMGWEVPGFRVSWTTSEGEEKEGPGLVTRRFTATLNEKSNLGKLLREWRGRPFSEEEKKKFDIRVLLDKPCTLVTTIEKSKKTGNPYAKVVTALNPKKGDKIPERETQLTLYDPSSAEAPQVLERLPKFIRELCVIGHKLDTPVSAEQLDKVEPEPVQKAPAPEKDADDFDDDIPF